MMSDRIAIFSEGRIEQVGSGEDLYDRPVSLFVADFIGESNILRGRYEADGADGGWMTEGSTRWRVGPAAVAPGVARGRSGGGHRHPPGADADRGRLGTPWRRAQTRSTRRSGRC